MGLTVDSSELTFLPTSSRVTEKVGKNIKKIHLDQI